MPNLAHTADAEIAFSLVVASSLNNAEPEDGLQKIVMVEYLTAVYEDNERNAAHYAYEIVQRTRTLDAHRIGKGIIRVTREYPHDMHVSYLSSRLLDIMLVVDPTLEKNLQ